MAKQNGGDDKRRAFYDNLIKAQSNGNISGIPTSYEKFSVVYDDPEKLKAFHGNLLDAQSNGNLSGIPDDYEKFSSAFSVGKPNPEAVTPAPSGGGAGRVGGALSRASQLPSQSQSGVPRPEDIGLEVDQPVISETVQEVDFDPNAATKASDYEIRVSKDALKIRDLTSRLGDDLAFKLLSNEPITEDEKREVLRKTAGSPFYSYAERINLDNPIEAVRDAFEGEGFLNDAIEQVTLEKKQQRISRLGQRGYEAMKADAVRFHGDKAEQVIRNTEQLIQDSFLSDTDRKISEANREINEILRKDEITAEDRKRVADLRREVNNIDESANTLFDPATGKFISGNEYKKLDASVQSEIQSFNDDVLRLSEEARNTPMDVLIDERREAYYAMKGAEKLFEKSRLELGANPRMLSDPVSTVQSFLGEHDSNTKEFDERRADYEEAQKRFLALNRAVALNQDPAEVERGFGDIVSRFSEGLGFDNTFDNRDYVEKLTEVFKENGIELTDGQKERVEMSFGEELASGLGATTRIGVELAFNAVLANKAKALMNLPKYVRAFEAMMSTRYGKTGRVLSKVLVNAGANVEQGLLFELSGSDYATGVGESVGEGAFTGMLDLLTKGKAGVLSKKWARIIGGTGGEIVGEYVGDFTSNLNELGITNIEEVMDRTFGATMEEGARKLLLTSMIVLPLTGSVEVARAFKPKVDEAAAKYPNSEAAQEAKKMVDDIISGDATEFVKPVSEIEPGEEILKPIDLEEQTTKIDETGEQEAEGRIDLGTDGEAGDAGEGEVGDTPTPEEDAARLEEIRAEEVSLGRNVQRIPVEDIIVAPDVFQFKAVDEADSGVNKAEKLEGKFDEDLAQSIGVWVDKENELGGGADAVYVVDGHHRLDLAKRSGVDNMNVYYIQAPTAKDARRKAAMANIAQGRGTAIDAAKVFRDSESEMEAFVPKSKVGRDGLMISKLSDGLFDLVAQKKMPVNVGVIIGKNIDSQDLQEQFYNMIKGKNLTNATIEIMAQDVAASPKKKEVVTDLFGTTEKEMADYESRAKFVSGVRGVMARAKNLLGKAAKGKDFLEEFGNKIDQEKSAGASQEAAVAVAVFDKLRNTSSEVRALIDEGMERIANGEKASKVRDDIAKKIIDIAEDVFKGKPTKQSKDEKEGKQEGVEGSMLEGVRSGRDEKEGQQESAELRTEEEGQEVVEPRDVESTAKALEGKDIRTIISPTEINKLNKQLYNNLLSKQKELLGKGVKDFENNPEYKSIKEQINFSEALIKNDAKAISEAYHKAKADGSNPELVKAVENLLGKPKEQKSKERSKPAEKPEAKERKPEAKERPKPAEKTGKAEVEKPKGEPKARKAEVKPSPDENLSNAKEAFGSALSEWLASKKSPGAFFDPKSQAEADVKLLNALINLIKAAGIKAASDIKSYLKGEGLEVDDEGAKFIASKVSVKDSKPRVPRERKLSTFETIKKSPREPLSKFMEGRSKTYVQESLVDNLAESRSWIETPGRTFDEIIDVASRPSFTPGLRMSVQNGISVITLDFLSEQIETARKNGESTNELSRLIMSIAEGLAIRNKDAGAAVNMNKLFGVADPYVMIEGIKRQVAESRKDEKKEKRFGVRYKKYKKAVSEDFKKASKSRSVQKVLDPSAERKKQIRAKRKELIGELKDLVGASGVAFNSWQEAKKNLEISKKILEIAKTFIDEGLVDFDKFHRSVSASLRGVVKFKKSDYAEIYEDLTGNLAGDNVSEIAKKRIKEQAKLDGFTLNEIIDEWISGDKNTVETLIDTIISKTNLNADVAKRLAEALVAEVNKMAKERESNLIDAFFKRRERSKAKAEAEKESDKKAKSIAAKIDKMAELNGIVDADLLRDYYGEMFGIYQMDDAIFEEALKYAIAAKKTTGAVREEAIKNWMNLISRAYGPPSFGDVYWSLFYASVLSGTSTAVVNFKGNLFMLAFDSVSSALSPVPMFLAISDAYKNNGSVKDAFHAMALSNPVASMLFRIMFLAKLHESVREGSNALVSGTFDSKWIESSFTSGNKISVSPMESKSLRETKILGKKIDDYFLGKGVIRGYEILKYVGRSLAATDVMFRGFNLNANVVPIAINYHIKNGKKPVDAVKIAFENLYNIDKGSRSYAKSRVADLANIYESETGKKLSRLQLKAAFYAELRALMPTEVLSKATEIARESTLQGEMRGWMGGLGRLVQMAQRNRVLSYPARKIVPFVRTLVNLTNITFDYSPYGFLRAFDASLSSLSGLMATSETKTSIYRTSKLSSDPNFVRDPMFSLQIGRAIVGSVSFVFAANLINALIEANGREPEDDDPFIVGTGAGLDKDQRRLYLKGRQPNTVRLWKGGPILNYLDYPISPILSYVAAYTELSYNDPSFDKKDSANRALIAGSIAMQAALDKGFFTSLSKALSIQDRRYKAEDFIDNPLRSVFGIVADGLSPMNPLKLNLVQQMEQVIDPERTSPEELEDYIAYMFLGRLYAGGKKDLDYFGDPVSVYPGSYQISWAWLRDLHDEREDHVHNFLSDNHLYSYLPKQPDFIPFNEDGILEPTEEMEYIHKYTFGREMKKMIQENLVNASDNEISLLLRSNRIYKKDGTSVTKSDLKSMPYSEKREFYGKLIRSFKKDAQEVADMTLYGSIVNGRSFNYNDADWVKDAKSILRSGNTKESFISDKERVLRDSER